MESVLRFRPSLVCGAYSVDNPEELKRDPEGEYMKYADHVAEVSRLKGIIDNWRFGEDN